MFRTALRRLMMTRALAILVRGQLSVVRGSNSRSVVRSGSQSRGFADLSDGIELLDALDELALDFGGEFLAGLKQFLERGTAGIDEFEELLFPGEDLIFR